MPTFEYEGQTTEGKQVFGKLAANHEEAAAAQLFERGITPIILQESKTSTSQELSWALIRKKLNLGLIPNTELIIFSRQMYRLSKAGVPVLSSLARLIDTTDCPPLADILRQVANTIASGQNLAEALREHPRVFSPLYIGVIEVGENTGHIDRAFLQVSEYLEMEGKTAKRLKSALRYPAFVIISIAIALVVMNLVVLPSFAKLFSRFGAALPLPTRLLLGMSNFIIHNGYLILIGFIALLFLFFRWIKTEKGRFIWDKFILRIFLVGKLIEKVVLARFTRSFAMIMDAGVPVLRCLALSAWAVGNRYMTHRILSIRNGIERGESLSHASQRSGIFTPLVLQMLEVGEESGSLSEILKEVADYYEAEVDYALENLSASMEPVLLSIIAGMILVLALGIFLPMWDMLSAIRGK